MKKTSKILFLLILVVMLIFTFSITVNAANEVDYSGYQELEESSNKTTNTTGQEKTQTQTTATDTKTTTQNTTVTKSDKATTTLPQTGANIVYGIAGIALVATVIFAYTKMKKYNY